MRPLDNTRTSKIMTQCNIMHLHTMHTISAWSRLDNAHRYSLNAEHVFALDESNAHVIYTLTYTYKGKSVNTHRSVNYNTLAIYNKPHENVKHAEEGLKKLAERCRELLEQYADD